MLSNCEFNAVSGENGNCEAIYYPEFRLINNMTINPLPALSLRVYWLSILRVIYASSRHRIFSGLNFGQELAKHQPNPSQMLTEY